MVEQMVGEWLNKWLSEDGVVGLKVNKKIYETLKNALVMSEC